MPYRSISAHPWHPLAWLSSSTVMFGAVATNPTSTATTAVLIGAIASAIMAIATGSRELRCWLDRRAHPAALPPTVPPYCPQLRAGEAIPLDCPIVRNHALTPQVERLDPRP